MILLDGKKLSGELLGALRKDASALSKPPLLAIVIVGEHPVIEKFVAQKKKTAEMIGVNMRVFPFPESVTTNALRKRIAEIAHDKKNDGIVVQLPLPPHINTQYILNAVPPEKDVDVLSARALGNFYVGKPLVLPTVVGAIALFFEKYRIDDKGKYAVVVGAGRLVGRPAATWLIDQGITTSVVNADTERIADFTRNADIIISGAGRAKLITGDMVKDGAVVVDAGTSESEGQIVGDVDFASVSAKASYLSPVPGGVGPLTVAVLFRNLFILTKMRKK